MSKESRVDVREKITMKIVEHLEAGARPWFSPWNAKHAAGSISRPLRSSGVPYQGVNVLSLWVNADSAGYASPYWLTYKQAQELGGNVRKGEHGSPVVYSSTWEKTDQTEDGEETKQKIPFLREYTVFNAEQCDGLPAHYRELVPVDHSTPQERIGAADAFFARTGARIDNGGNRAFYSLTEDRIQLPDFPQFRDSESYYAVLAHEMTHWTRHPSRLNRDLGRKKWGDEGYALEELVAEIGSAYLCADLGISPEVREDHSSYIGAWLKILKEDKSAIFTAASHASKAAEYLRTLQGLPGESSPPESN